MYEKILKINKDYSVNRTKAFTLIELLVVIAIIALLMSILTPVLRKARESAKETICRSHLRAIGLGIIIFLQDNNYTMADCSRANGFFWYDSNGNFRNDDETYWGVRYKDYIKETEVFSCPSFRRVSELIYDVDPLLIQEAAFGFNGNISSRRDEKININDLKNHSKVIIAHDHAEPKMEQRSRDMFHNEGPNTMNLIDYREGGMRSEFYRGIFRHNIRISKDYETGGRANILRLDGHVDSLNETTGDDVPEEWYTGGLEGVGGFGDWRD